MPRVKRGIIHLKKRRKLLSKVKGFKWGRKSLMRLATTAALKAGAHAYYDRKKKKIMFRRLWQIKIGAAVKEEGMSYSQFMGELKKKNIEIDRKILADLAEKERPIFQQIVAKVKN